MNTLTHSWFGRELILFHENGIELLQYKTYKKDSNGIYNLVVNTIKTGREKLNKKLSEITTNDLPF